MATERTLVLIKPDAMRRGLAGEILGRLERRGLVLRGADLVHVDRDLALSMPDNLVHGSDSPESAARELALWFPDLD